MDAVRAGIREDGPAFTAAVAAAAKAGLQLDLSESMIRLPRGFEDVTDPVLVPAVKARHLILRRDLTRHDVASPGLVQLLAGAAQAGLAFLRFGWDAIEEAGPPPDWSRLR